MKYEHDCSHCTFIGTFADMDVHICKGETEFQTSIIARFSSDGPDYASSPVSIFKDQIKNNKRICGNNEDGTAWDMTFHDYLMSDKIIPYHKAWLIALAMTPA